MIKKGINGELVVADGDKLYVSDSSGLREYDRASMDAQVIEITSTEVSFSEINTVKAEKLYDQLKKKAPDHNLIPELKKELDARYIKFKEAVAENEKNADKDETLQDVENRTPASADKTPEKEHRRVKIITTDISADGDHQISTEQEGEITEGGTIVLKNGRIYSRSAEESYLENRHDQDIPDFAEDKENYNGNARDEDDKLAAGASYEEISESSSSEDINDILARRDEIPVFSTEDYEVDETELMPAFDDPRWADSM